jgi:hypothetical protein
MHYKKVCTHAEQNKWFCTIACGVPMQHCAIPSMHRVCVLRSRPSCRTVMSLSTALHCHFSASASARRPLAGPRDWPARLGGAARGGACAGSRRGPGPPSPALPPPQQHPSQALSASGGDGAPPHRPARPASAAGRGGAGRGGTRWPRARARSASPRSPAPAPAPDAGGVCIGRRRGAHCV